MKFKTLRALVHGALSALLVKPPAVIAASNSDRAFVGLRSTMRIAMRMRSELANFFHFAMSPP